MQPAASIFLLKLLLIDPHKVLFWLIIAAEESEHKVVDKCGFPVRIEKLAKQKSSATGDDAAFAKSEQKNEKAKLSMQTTDDHNNAQLIVVKRIFKSEPENK